ncbi:hypothetical protein GMLC_05710 [Geomonas limicola]|uniref:histidine kinase n=1 Tax=Geomonas limicola TaxID=2740186 RepID=A0A6V8N379_9BACT|nr:ATP-binding protein [Geomonas limicola]GFO66992.1 hypothetical protein GMLC_05710 [Geomonas limicola]
MSGDQKHHGKDASLRERAERQLISQGPSQASREHWDAKRLLHELEVHQIELSMQYDELVQTKQNLLAEMTWKDELVDWLAHSSQPSGEPFFERLARYLARALSVDFVCIDRLEGNGLTAKTLAVWCDGGFQDNVVYSLKDTPCGDVVGKAVCCFPARVRHLFPKDEVLQDLKAEGYLGVTLWSHLHEPIGLIAVISRTPLKDFQMSRSLLSIIATRAASELERVTAEEALRASEANFRSYYELGLIGMALASLGKRWLQCNDCLCELLGYPREELLQLSWSELTHPDDREADDRELERVILGEAEGYTLDKRFIRKNGSIVHTVFSVRCIRDRVGTPHHFVALVLDISYRKEAEASIRAIELQLHQNQKLESLGVLAGGIAHDFNNILGIIIGYCSLMELNPGDTRMYLPEIVKAAERAGGLCQQMLAYAGKVRVSSSTFSLSELVREVAGMLKTTLKHNVTLTKRVPSDFPSVTGDASQIRQVVMNLILNAAEAIGTEQGEIRVTLRHAVLTAGEPEFDYGGQAVPAGSYLLLEVADNGCGMDEETRARVFEPFYTTKFAGRGLGMSAVLGIMKAHRGALQLETESGRGTSFRVYLPVSGASEAVAAVEPTPPQSVEPWRGEGCVLLADDEEHVLLVVRTMLTALGFSVIEAVNGQDALEKYRIHAREISLVVADLGMPVMDGYQLIRELKSLRPDLPIVVSSGFGDAEVAASIPREQIVGVVCKPYTFEQLREVLRCATTQGAEPLFSGTQGTPAPTP